MAGRYARQMEGIELSPAVDGFMIHVEELDRVHYLNPTAAAVLQLCDGATSDDEIARLLQEHFDLPAPPSEEVSKILDQFAEAGLISDGPSQS